MVHKARFDNLKSARSLEAPAVSGQKVDFFFFNDDKVPHVDILTRSIIQVLHQCSKVTEHMTLDQTALQLNVEIKKKKYKNSLFAPYLGVQLQSLNTEQN